MTVVSDRLLLVSVLDGHARWGCLLAMTAADGDAAAKATFHGVRWFFQSSSIIDGNVAWTER